MNLGEVNKGAIALILVLLLGAGGYLWYSMMYKPAVAEKTTAAAAEKTAQDGLAAAKSKLAAAQQAIDEAKKENSKLDPSVSKLQVASKAVPREKLIDDAAIVLMDIARRADIRTSFKSGGEEDAATQATASAGLSGATPIDLKFKAAGTYSEMMLFMRLVEDTVIAEDGKLYARDRLFNVVKLEIGGDDEESNSSSSFSPDGGLESNDQDANEIVALPGEIVFTVTVRMYTSSTENAAGVGAATPDPAAAPTDGTTDPNAAGGTGTGDPNAAGGATTGTDPNAGGTGTGDPNAAGGATAGTDPNAGGAPATDTAAAGAAGGV